jgi:hypothetical protein
MTVKKMPVKKKTISKREAEIYLDIGKQSLDYFYVDQLRHQGKCYVKGDNHPIRLDPKCGVEIAWMETSPFIEAARKNRRAKMKKVLTIVNE